MDGLFALHLLDVVTEVLRSSNSNKSPKTQALCVIPNGIAHPNPNRRETETSINCRMWTMLPQKHTLLKVSLSCTLEDNKAVIKMIIKGRSPTMRHVSRTHRVVLDWLFQSINFDPKIQIKYIDTKNQNTDILTKENFTHDEWNHLLCLFNISHFSSARLF